MRNNIVSPIGIFDSGLGGLSVMQEMIQILPKESIIYFADSGNCPYGQKRPDEIISLSDKITSFLLEKHCKIIVLACNTATGTAINFLRQKYPDIEFVGIEPATKPAAQFTKTGHIGILATENTIRSDHFINTKNQHAGHVKVHIQPGTGLVDIVENNQMNRPETANLLKRYLEPMLDQGIDALVLGCTHYPFLIPAIKKIVPATVRIFNPAPAVAIHTKNILKRKMLLNKTKYRGEYTFYTSGKKYILEIFIRNNLFTSPLKNINVYAPQPKPQP